MCRHAPLPEPASRLDRQELLLLLEYGCRLEGHGWRWGSAMAEAIYASQCMHNNNRTIVTHLPCPSPVVRSHCYHIYILHPAVCVGAPRYRSALRPPPDGTCRSTVDNTVIACPVLAFRLVCRVFVPPGIRICAGPQQSIGSGAAPKCCYSIVMFVITLAGQHGDP